jgi:hypothetical protein
MSAKLYALPLAVGMMAAVATADAAPVAGAAAGLKVETGSALETVGYRNCWREWGRIVCARPAPRVYSFHYGPPRPRYHGFYHWGYRRW